MTAQEYSSLKVGDLIKCNSNIVFDEDNTVRIRDLGIGLILEAKGNSDLTITYKVLWSKLKEIIHISTNHSGYTCWGSSLKKV